MPRSLTIHQEPIHMCMQHFIIGLFCWVDVVLGHQGAVKVRGPSRILASDHTQQEHHDGPAPVEQTDRGVAAGA